MTRATLWIEMTIAGAVYVAALFFVLAGINGVHASDIKCLVHRYDYLLTYIGVAVIALSYIFGFVAHRFIQITFCRLWEFFVYHQPCKFIGDLLKKASVERDLEGRMREETTVWEMSPERIHREIDFQFAQVALLRSLVVSVPCLFFSIRHWCLITESQDWRHGYWVGLAAFWVPLLLAFWRQSEQYGMIRSAALDVGKRHAGNLMPSLSPTSGRVGDLVTIRGANFGMKRQTVRFNDTPATVTIWEPTRIVVPVPDVKVDNKPATLTIRVVWNEQDTNTGENFELQLTCPQFKLEAESGLSGLFGRLRGYLPV